MSDLLDLFTMPLESQENSETAEASSSRQASGLPKSSRKSLPLNLLQTVMASAMANIINRMTNKNDQENCKIMLSATEDSQVERNILLLLQAIDNEISTAKKEKKVAKAQKKCATKRSTRKKQAKSL